MSILRIDASARDVAVVTIDAAREQTIVADVPAGKALTVIVITHAKDADVTLTCEGTVAERGSLTWQFATLDAKAVRHSVTSAVNGPQGTSAVDWLFAAQHDADWHLSVRNVFAASGGRGEVTMRGAAQDRAKVTCRGMIDIRDGGTGTETYLTQNVLMLDPSAKIDAVPALEIHTDNVRASHSATVSRLTPDDLFYLTSRGIADGEARRLYVSGFLGDLASHIKDEQARNAVLHAIDGFGKR